MDTLKNDPQIAAQVASSSMPSNTPPKSYQFAGGEPVAPQLSADWALYQAMPVAAQNSLWEVVQIVLRNGDTEQIQQRAEAFSQLYEVSAEALDSSVRVSNYLFTQSARLDLSQADLRADLLAFGIDARGIDALLLNFETAKAVVRDGIVRSTLLDHGSVLTRVDWRVDQMMASSRGQGLSSPVIKLSLQHQHGSEATVTSLQLTPTALRELLSVCTRIDQGLRASERAAESSH